LCLPSRPRHDTMARRSARLSAGTPAIKDDLAREPAVPPTANTGRKRKNAAEPQINGDATPSTPKRKRAAKAKIPPATPTPAAVGLMSAPYSSGEIDDTAPPPINRLAVPNGTNAPLLSPETHRVISNKRLDQVSPSKASKIKTTTGNILDEALAHLIKIEPKLKPVIEQHPCHVFSPAGLAEEIDPFRSLVSGIISQQVSESHVFVQKCRPW
jgi:DNA-3-methyladenine glycosylase II